jgi:hypothetical protein
MSDSGILLHVDRYRPSGDRILEVLMALSPVSVRRSRRSLLLAGVSLVLLAGCRDGSVDTGSSSTTASGAYVSPTASPTVDITTSTASVETIDVVEAVSWAAIDQVIGSGREARVYGTPPAGVSMVLPGQRRQFPITCAGKRYLPKGASVAVFS